MPPKVGRRPAGRLGVAAKAKAGARIRPLGRPAAVERTPEGEFEDYKAVSVGLLQPARLLDSGRLWFTEVVYWKEETQCVGVCTRLQRDAGEWWTDIKVAGTKSEHLLKYLSGVDSRQIQGHLCQEGCAQETSGDDFIHIKKVRKLKDSEEEEWMKNLLEVRRDERDELMVLRREAAEGAPEVGAEDTKKAKKLDKKEKEKKKKEVKRTRSPSPVVARKGGRDLSSILGGSGLDPNPKKRNRMLKKAKRIIGKKKKKKSSASSSRSSGDVDSSSGSSTSQVMAGDIFGQTRTAKRVASQCPGVLTATSVAAVQEQLLTAQGQMWELDRKELPPLFLQYFRGRLAQTMQPAMRREAVHVSYCLDLGLMGRIPQLLDVLAQRLKALEGQASGKHWSVTSQYELVPEEQGPSPPSRRRKPQPGRPGNSDGSRLSPGAPSGPPRCRREATSGSKATKEKGRVRKVRAKERKEKGSRRATQETGARSGKATRRKTRTRANSGGCGGGALSWRRVCISCTR